MECQQFVNGFELMFLLQLVEQCQPLADVLRPLVVNFYVFLLVANFVGQVAEFNKTALGAFAELVVLRRKFADDVQTANGSFQQIKHRLFRIVEVFVGHLQTLAHFGCIF